MSEQTIEQKLSAEIVTLKSRILDTQDQAARLMEESKILQGTLAEIARAVGITGDTIKVEEIVEAVKNLTAESTAESTDEAKDEE
ncbi:tail fiber chaperone [Escherichia phage vB_EcoM-UFV13]|uniref:Tail fiber assembly protein n=1 Tax=Escherichia phage vB_EcoM-UFV13 TaxID=1815590 RepID=A0A166LVL6_9CAUD|nr:tail fiber chaperone [Escherichia phage vB_EcoM-UFV13]ANA50178.1 tail fiber assembly protein [Escherichia phage vB_EcoM-UFV13]